MQSSGDGPKSEEERMRAFLDVTDRIPATWTCIGCGKEFDNSPDGTMPAGMRIGFNKRTGMRFIEGKLCTACMK
jgi:hypothetical protein